ncbi:lantibiotic immunity ABC transporter MutE/EpiE family permease subunit [Staphylococcus epidermidis]|uniref:lantibiotic immunity ABC transporter MutE/EpiE family permease subunit n=1 Tax=Staphylococcus epidermidis TaxID=1282 RepID=UPI000D1C6D91|nr:lantibiotic immunity ABC transporter MutE/EpiE family permease subunit [Staphylococcus epidermidis]PTE90219.1 lantibiotic immunity ABC transporter MutE/EpiE family permease subunit [Staphylococcus epidermidis]
MKEIKAEVLKFKNTTAMYVLFLSPLFFLGFALFTALFAQSSPNKDDISPFLSLLFNLWPYFVMPIIICIACSSMIGIEKRNGLFNYYVSNNWSINKMIRSKILIMSIALLLHTIIMFLVALTGNMLVGGNSINLFLILVTLFLIFFVSLPLIPINFILVKCFGVFLSIFLNIALTLISIIFITMSKFFWITPWSYIGRIPLITLSLNPNGTLMSKNSSYFNDLNSLALTIIVSIIYFSIFFILNNKKSWNINEK